MITGIWKHIKTGKLYFVVCQVRHTETRINHILYFGLGISGLWIRPSDMFLDGRFRKIL